MEFLNAVAELSVEPAGYATRGWPGWTFFQVPSEKHGSWPQEWDNEPIRLGSNTYPGFFEFEITEESEADQSDEDHLWVVLAFLWQPEREEFGLGGALSLNHSLEVALERLFKLRPLEFWRRKALFHLAYYTNNDGRTMRAGAPGTWSAEQLAAADAGIRSAIALPSSKRRDRVTAQVLEQAAAVYREAWRDGKNPTQAVADAFHKSHSTAARWVGQARKIGILGPADGSRGGEVGPVDFKASDE